MQEEKQQEETAVAFVTKKVLISFAQPICIMLGETAVWTQGVIAEYLDAEQHSRMSIPEEFTVVGLTDGRKLSKSLRVKVASWHTAIAMVELPLDYAV